MRAYEQIAEMLRASIQDRRLTPGTILLESQLAEIFGASRTPVRQALDTLFGEGLLSRFDGRGLVVGDGTAPLRRAALGASDLSPGHSEVVKHRGWQKLYHDVERSLIYCSVFGGFRVNELELANHFSIGRTIARDVLLQAERNGLLTKDDSAHWVTVTLNQKRLDDLYDLREILEPAALISAIGQAAPPALAHMRTRLKTAMLDYPNISAQRLDQLEHDLHIDCVGQSTNPELLQALQRTRCVIISSRHILGSIVALPAFDPFLEEHDCVLKAMLAQDEAAIRTAMLAHLRSARVKVGQRLSRFRDEGQVPQFSFIGNPKIIPGNAASQPLSRVSKERS